MHVPVPTQKPMITPPDYPFWRPVELQPVYVNLCMEILLLFFYQNLVIKQNNFQLCKSYSYLNGPHYIFYNGYSAINGPVYLQTKHLLGGACTYLVRHFEDLVKRLLLTKCGGLFNASGRNFEVIYSRQVTADTY